MKKQSKNFSGGNGIGSFFKSQKPRFANMIQSQGFQSSLGSVLAAILGLFVGLILMIIVNPSQAFQGIGIILAGGFNNGLKSIGDVIYYAVPILMTGLSVGFAFKTGLFNIGAPGQYTMGMFGALLVGFYGQNVIPAGIHWLVCLVVAMIFGMAWGAIPGLFKALFNVHEVIASIMSNYIGLFLVDMLVKGNSLMFNLRETRTFPLPSSAILPKFGLNAIFPGSKAHGGFLIAILIAVLIYVILNKTTFGFELKAVGLNKDASKYVGINEKKNIVLAMAIAGGLAGIGGAMMIQSHPLNSYEPVNILAANGFNGIPVALLGLSNPLGIIFAALFIAHLQTGGFYMQGLNFVPEIIDIIIGVIIYFSAFALIITTAIPKILKKIKEKKKGKGETPLQEDENLKEDTLSENKETQEQAKEEEKEPATEIEREQEQTEKNPEISVTKNEENQKEDK